MIQTKTTVDGETSEDLSTRLELPVTSDFGVMLDNGGLVVSGINEISDSTNGVTTKRDIVVEVEFDRALSKKIAEACKQMPRLPE